MRTLSDVLLKVPSLDDLWGSLVGIKEFQRWNILLTVTSHTKICPFSELFQFSYNLLLSRVLKQFVSVAVLNCGLTAFLSCYFCFQFISNLIVFVTDPIINLRDKSIFKDYFVASAKGSGLCD